MAHNYIIILRRKVQIAKLMAEHIKILPIEFYDGKSRSHPTVSESRPIPLPIFILICVCPYGLTPPPHSRKKMPPKSRTNESNKVYTKRRGRTAPAAPESCITHHSDSHSVAYLYSDWYTRFVRCVGPWMRKYGIGVYCILYCIRAAGAR